jgi:hypothetical protein
VRKPEEAGALDSQVAIVSKVQIEGEYKNAEYRSVEAARMIK